MTPFRTHRGIVAAMDRASVDTDQIIPKQFLKRIERSGFGQYLFFDWRFLEGGAPDPVFELNQPWSAGATVLLARENFGSGSSREHAVWSLADFGFRALLAPSFADIFYNNCFKNGVLPVTLPVSQIDELFRRAAGKQYYVTVDLENERVTDDQGLNVPFTIEASRRQKLLQGWDDISLTLRHVDAIDRYEKANRLPSLKGS